VPVWTDTAGAPIVLVTMVLLTLSGIGWLLLGYHFTPLLVVKIVLVAAIWMLGPLIDNVVEPRFQKLAPGPAGPRSPAFIRIQKQYLTLDVIATLLFYVIIVIWVRS
jgi:branched-subunit amino acid permease